MTPFSNIEIQLIRSKLDIYSDGELAALLERPVEEVHEFINLLTKGGAAARSQMIQQQKEKEFAAEWAKTGKKLMDEEKKKKREAEQQKRNRIEVDEVKRKRELQLRDSNKKYQTRKIDYSQLRSVKVGKGSYLFVPDNISDAEAIRNYQKHYLSRRPDWVKKMEEMGN